MKKQLFVIIVILLTSIGMAAEIRSLWILPWDMQSPQAIDEAIQAAVANHQNELLLEVRYRADALYTPNRMSYKFPNPEPRSYILANDGFDPLEYAIWTAKPHGLRIQAWVVVFNATPTDSQRFRENYIYRYHPEWITHDADGNKMRSVRQFGYFIDPGIQAVQDYLSNILCDIVDGYPELDGLHLDYVRYPESRLGYHPESLRRFSEEGTGLSWNQWRAKLVTDFVRNLNQRVKEINPDILLTAAVFADIQAAREYYAQDWYQWLEEGIIDLAYPMAYNLDFEIYKNQLTSMKLHNFEDRVILGLRAWDQSGKSLLPWDNPGYNTTDIYRRIELARKHKFRGIALFSYNGLKPGDAFTHLAQMAFPAIDELASPSLLARSQDLPGSDSRTSIEIEADPQEPEVISVSSAIAEQPPVEIAAISERDAEISPPEQEPEQSKAIPEEQPEPTPVQQFSAISAELRIEIEDGYYVIHFDLPKEGRWHWQILSEDGTDIFERHRYFFAGQNQDYWDGILDSDDFIAEGDYILEYSLEDKLFQSRIHLSGDLD